MAREVVQIWRRLNPPGRFLTQDKSTGDNGLWNDVGDKKSREKASQCLRERTPDVMPFVKELEKKAEAEKREKKTRGGKASDSAPSSTKARSVESASGKSSNDDVKSNRSSRSGSSVGRRDPARETHEKHVAERLDHVPAAILSSVGIVSSSPSWKDGNAMPPPPPRRASEKDNSGIDKRTMSSRSLDSRGSNKKKGRKPSREEVAQAVPTAAALLDSCFNDDATMTSAHIDAGREAQAGGLTEEEYQNSLAEFLASAPEGEAEGEKRKVSREELIETMSKTSWVKSFQSIDTISMVSTGSTLSGPYRDGIGDSDDGEGEGRQLRRDPDSIFQRARGNVSRGKSEAGGLVSGTSGDAESLLRVIEEAPDGAFEAAAQEMADLYTKNQQQTPPEIQSRSQRMFSALQNGGGEQSNRSMLSDLTDVDGGVTTKSSVIVTTQRQQLKKSQTGTSGMSLLSDMTDLSAGVGSLGF